MQKKPFNLTLKITKGQCHLKVSVINGKQEPIPLSIIVHGSASAHQLKEIIFRKLPLELRNLQQSAMIVSIKRKQVEDDQFLFESLIDALEITELQDPNRGQRPNGSKHNKRELEATLQRALQVDQYLLTY